MTWLDDVIAVYGEPRVRVDTPVRRMRDDGGEYEKRCWVWFPAKRNHHIGIKRYRRWTNFEDRTTHSFWVVVVGSHLSSMPSVEWTTRTEPDDTVMGSLLALTGFLTTGIEVTA